MMCAARCLCEAFVSDVIIGHRLKGSRPDALDDSINSLGILAARLVLLSLIRENVSCITHLCLELLLCGIER